jgi:methionine-rich copper-binding protein CopC/putative copper export protein
MAIALVVPAAAAAHANLVRVEPPNGAVLARPPAAVRMTFDDPVQPGPGIAAVRNGGGSVLGGRAHVEARRILVVPLRAGLPDGDYSVRWSIFSDDGHLESGVLAFAVGLGRASPLPTLAPRATRPGVDSVGARWLFFAGVLGAVGIALFVFLVRVPDDERIPVVLSTAAVLAALGAAEEVHRVGLSTRDGTALGTGFVIALVVASTAAAATIDRRALRPALLLALPLAVVPSLSGHALDAGLPRVNVVADVVHVLAAAGWIGVLLGLLVVRGADARRAAALALASVVALGLTGVTRAAFELTALSQLWSSGYGRALLVKTGVLGLTLAMGFALRASVRRRAGVELALVAVLLVAVSVLVELRPGRNAATGSPVSVRALQPSHAPPPPPPGAVVLARESGSLGVAVAVEATRITAIVLSPAGGGLGGLDVRIDGHGTQRCGAGCYVAATAPGTQVHVAIDGFGATRTVAFVVPAQAPPADALVRRAAATYHALRSVAYQERLASDASHVLVAHWVLERPNRIEYSIPSGAAGIVIGARRWDRTTPGAKWVESSQTPLPQPATQWTYAANAHVLARTPRAITVSFVDPTIPAYFTVTFDRRTLRPRVLHMTAASHFMVDRYERFNAEPAIRPPR